MEYADMNEGSVIRFLAYFDHGFSMPVQKIVLGYGYGNDAGVPHDSLNQIYRTSSSKEDVYAGYLYIQDGHVKIAMGGSQTMKIDEDGAKNIQLSQYLQDIEILESSIIALFPLVLTASVPHVMLSISGTRNHDR